jgi:hypothetical protein
MHRASSSAAHMRCIAETSTVRCNAPNPKRESAQCGQLLVQRPLAALSPDDGGVASLAGIVALPRHSTTVAFPPVAERGSRCRLAAREAP